MRIIDLSHPIAQGQPANPWDPAVEVRVRDDMPHGINCTMLTISTHYGTHLDVPFHFIADGATLDKVPLERFIGPATLIRLPRAPGGHITKADLLPFEHVFQPGARVIYETGQHRLYGRAEFYVNMPSLDVEAAQWIATRKIGLLGMDTATPGEDAAGVHRALMGKGAEIIIVETLANLDKCPEHFTFVGLPMNLVGRDGSPIRAAAIVD